MFFDQTKLEQGKTKSGDFSDAKFKQVDLTINIQKESVMTKAELIAEMSKKSTLSKADSEKALNSFIDVAKKILKKEEKLALAGFGSFVVTKRKARKGRNPQTGESIKIKASKTVKFRAGKALKEKI